MLFGMNFDDFRVKTCISWKKIFRCVDERDRIKTYLLGERVLSKIFALRIPTHSSIKIAGTKTSSMISLIVARYPEKPIRIHTDLIV